MTWIIIVAFAAVLLLFLLKGGRQTPAQGAQKAAGNRGEEQVRAFLQSVGEPVSAVLWSGDLKHQGRRFEVDALALVAGVGVVVIEVKSWSGTLQCDAGEVWTQRNEHGRREHGNACQQAIRTAECVRGLLKRTRWWREGEVPVIPVVVFARDDLQIEVDEGEDGEGEPQTDLVQLGGLKQWLASARAQQPAPGFKPRAADAEELLALFRSYELQ